MEDSGTPDFQTLEIGGTVVGVTSVSIYKINSNEINHISLQVRSDGGTTDFIQDNLINGTLNDKYGYKVGSKNSYTFSEKAEYANNFENGLEYEEVEIKLENDQIIIGNKVYDNYGNEVTPT